MKRFFILKENENMGNCCSDEEIVIVTDEVRESEEKKAAKARTISIKPSTHSRKEVREMVQRCNNKVIQNEIETKDLNELRRRIRNERVTTTNINISSKGAFKPYRSGQAQYATVSTAYSSTYS